MTNLLRDRTPQTSAPKDMLPVRTPKGHMELPYIELPPYLGTQHLTASTTYWQLSDCIDTAHQQQLPQLTKQEP